MCLIKDRALGVITLAPKWLCKFRVKVKLICKIKVELTVNFKNASIPEAKDFGAVVQRRSNNSKSSSSGWKQSLIIREKSSYKEVGRILREKVSGMFPKAFIRYN